MADDGECVFFYLSEFYFCQLEDIANGILKRCWEFLGS